MYGGIVAGAYLFVRVRGHNGGLELFCAAAATGFVMHLVLWPRQTLAGFRERKMLVRGLLYGLALVLIFRAQAHGDTSSALVASTMGSVFGVIFGRIFLKEKVYGIALVAVGLCFVATFLNPLLILRSYFGVIGGLIQGAGFVLARSLMLDKKSIRQSISSGFAWSLLVALPVLFATHELHEVARIKPVDLFVAVSVLLIVQYSFFYLYKILDTQRASPLMLSRIPWAMGLEAGIFGVVITSGKALAGGLIILTATLLMIDSAKKARA